MRTEQVSVFAENRPGRLREMLAALAGGAVNIRALSIAETSEFGIIRMIVSDTEAALRALRDAGFTAIVSDVLAVEVPDQPGGLLGAVVAPLTDAGINIEYVYAFAERPHERALIVLKASDPAQAEAILGRAG
jgi:hypothetical protein